MHVYYCLAPSGDYTTHVGDLAAVRAWAKGLPKHLRFDAEITLHDIALDKANILRLLNVEGGTHSPPLRTWVVTDRGGIRESTERLTPRGC